MTRDDLSRPRPEPGGDVLSEVGVCLLRVHPGVLELGRRRFEDSGCRTEEPLVPVQLDDFREPVPLLELADALARVVRIDAEK